MTKLKTLKGLKFFKLMEDIIQIAKYKCWDDDVGDMKAQEIIDKIHKGKYGDNQGIWVQVDNLSIELRQEAVKWIKNLQSSNTEYSIVLESLPEDMKGECAKDIWNQTNFRYGSEYGMIAWIKYFFNITEENLKEEK